MDGASLLKSFVERIEAQDELRTDIGVEIKGLYAEAKSSGFDTKTLRKVVARRKKGEQAIREEQELVELYEGAISGQMKLPLDEAASEQVERRAAPGLKILDDIAAA